MLASNEVLQQGNCLKWLTDNNKFCSLAAFFRCGQHTCKLVEFKFLISTSGGRALLCFSLDFCLGLLFLVCAVFSMFPNQRHLKIANLGCQSATVVIVVAVERKIHLCLLVSLFLSFITFHRGYLHQQQHHISPNQHLWSLLFAHLSISMCICLHFTVCWRPFQLNTTEWPLSSWRQGAWSVMMMLLLMLLLLLLIVLVVMVANGKQKRGHHQQMSISQQGTNTAHQRTGQHWCCVFYRSASSGKKAKSVFGANSREDLRWCSRWSFAWWWWCSVPGSF